MKLPTAARLPFSFDVAALQIDLKQLEQTDWITHYRTEDYQGDWSVLPLRSVHGHPSVIHASPSMDMYEDTPFLKTSPYFQKVVAHFKCPIASVRLMRLAVDASIAAHTDDMGDQDVRIHIPIQTHPNVQFWIGGKRVLMQAGEVWMGDFNLPHAVQNDSPIDRVHLVVDAKRNPWLEQQIFGF